MKKIFYLLSTFLLTSLLQGEETLYSEKELIKALEGKHLLELGCEKELFPLISHAKSYCAILAVHKDKGSKKKIYKITADALKSFPDLNIKLFPSFHENFMSHVFDLIQKEKIDCIILSDPFWEKPSLLEKCREKTDLVFIYQKPFFLLKEISSK